MLAVFSIALVAACAPTNSAHRAAESPAATAPVEAHRELLSRLIGHWVLTGVIAGQNVVHDVEGAWALQSNYVRLDEVSRETSAAGRPQYEAAIYVGWLDSAHHYVCLWLDNTEVASGDVTCIAADTPGVLPFEFRDAHGALQIATTFTYHRADNTWTWQIDNVDAQGRHTQFATLTMRRR
jgi:hypothetical protein